MDTVEVPHALLSREHRKEYGFKERMAAADFELAMNQLTTKLDQDRKLNDKLLVSIGEEAQRVGNLVKTFGYRRGKQDIRVTHAIEELRVVISEALQDPMVMGDAKISKTDVAAIQEVIIHGQIQEGMEQFRKRKQPEAHSQDKHREKIEAALARAKSRDRDHAVADTRPQEAGLGDLEVPSTIPMGNGRGPKGHAGGRGRRGAGMVA